MEAAYRSAARRYSVTWSQSKARERSPRLENTTVPDTDIRSDHLFWLAGKLEVDAKKERECSGGEKVTLIRKKLFVRDVVRQICTRSINTQTRVFIADTGLEMAADSAPRGVGLSSRPVRSNAHETTIRSRAIRPEAERTTSMARRRPSGTGMARSRCGGGSPNV